MTKKLRDIMSAAPVYMAPGQSALAAARAMKRHSTGTVLVLADGELRGLVTDRDIAVRVLAENRDPGTTLIGDLCRGEVATPRSRRRPGRSPAAGPRAGGTPHPGPGGRDPGGRGVGR